MPKSEQGVLIQIFRQSLSFAKHLVYCLELFLFSKVCSEQISFQKFVVLWHISTYFCQLLIGAVRNIMPVMDVQHCIHSVYRILTDILCFSVIFILNHQYEFTFRPFMHGVYHSDCYGYIIPLIF